MGLHQRYARLLSGVPDVFLAGRKEQEDEIRKKLSVLFDGMMKAVYRTEGAQLSIDILSTPRVREFIESHSSVLDSSFEKVEMSDAMRKRLQRSDFIFSGLKTFHELNEAFPSLIDENGERKPFERFLNDVRSIDHTYNSNYLRAEYNFVTASAEMAARWDRFMQDGDRYNLQYRTQKDDKVRPEHAALDGVTLPPSDPFWAEFYPPNGWNCRCTVVQVRKSKYPATSHEEAMRLGDEALQRDTKGIFRFNPGLEQKTVPDYNPYTIRRCRDCDIAKGKSNLVRLTPPDNQLCQACRLLHKCGNGYYTLDEYGDRLKISNDADLSEIKPNIRAAKTLLDTFPKMDIKIREHVLEDGVKNPEYVINGLIADRKGIMSEKGITAGFSKAVSHQGCSCVVFDFDMHLSHKDINLPEIAKRIDWRRKEFEDGTIKECYVLWRNNAVRIGPEHKTRQQILSILQKIKP